MCETESSWDEWCPLPSSWSNWRRPDQGWSGPPSPPVGPEMTRTTLYHSRTYLIVGYYKAGRHSGGWLYKQPPLERVNIVPSYLFSFLTWKFHEKWLIFITSHIECRNPVASRKLEGCLFPTYQLSSWMKDVRCLFHTPVAILDVRWPPPYKGLASLTCGYIQRWTPRWGVVIFTIPTNFGKYRSNSFYCLYNINFMKHCWPLGLPPFSLEGMPEMSGVTTNHYWPPSTRLVNNRGSVCPGSWLGYCEPEERIYSNVDAGKDGCKPALLCLPTFLPIYLFIYLCTYLLTYLPTYLHIYDFPNYSATISLTTYTYDFPNYSSTISPTTFLSTHHPTLQSLYQPKTNRTTEHGFVVIQNDTDELCC